MTNEEEREFHLEIRKARLIEVAAIEKRYPSKSVTVVVRREYADEVKRLIESLQNNQT